MIAQFGPTGLRYSRSDRPAILEAVSVVLVGTSTTITLYTDLAGTNTAPNPTLTDAFGNLTFYAQSGDYELLVRGARVPVSLRSIDQGTADIESALLIHTNSATPHPSYDDIEDLSVLLENRLV